MQGNKRRRTTAARTTSIGAVSERYRGRLPVVHASPPPAAFADCGYTRRKRARQRQTSRARMLAVMVLSWLAGTGVHGMPPARIAAAYAAHVGYASAHAARWICAARTTSFRELTGPLKTEDEASLVHVPITTEAAMRDGHGEPIRDCLMPHIAKFNSSWCAQCASLLLELSL